MGRGCGVRVGVGWGLGVLRLDYNMGTLSLRMDVFVAERVTCGMVVICRHKPPSPQPATRPPFIPARDAGAFKALWAEFSNSFKNHCLCGAVCRAFVKIVRVLMRCLSRVSVSMFLSMLLGHVLQLSGINRFCKEIFKLFCLFPTK